MAGTDPGRSILSFIDDARFLPEAAANPALRVLLVATPLETDARAVLHDVVIVVTDDPRWAFYSLHNQVALTSTLETEPSVIADSASIHPTAFVDPIGVEIGANVIIEANATVLRSARIGANAVIRAGAVIGTSGFEHKRTSRGVLSVVHDGETVIGEGSEIGSLTVVGRGFSRRHTRLGADCRIDCNVMIAHGSQLGERVFVAAGAVLAGSTAVGDDVWVGPNATLIDRVRVGAGARIGIGSVVFREVSAGDQVLGNPARVVARS
ncbi:hypothetical protein L687_00735 [Microbacterium maritypicum MF109]|uniref:UDP-3-O-[3-hydroxymyristoyl] glucosamine N-acyltransferase non-repeat region domain-containing protein n=2 Tax=Microbacteriaceae TaxID=85023 RepID=T5KKI3_MICMQ|nr:hypothetical protein L687_00735 [Microbacterium maritypicum MF109]